ncbi:MAG TPA: hypothetical protein VF012_06805 [Nocardioidaceae bacterium]
MSTPRCLSPARRATLPLLAALVALLAVVPSWAPPSAEAAGRWAPAAKARIHPGVQMYTKGMQCTGNFVFKDRKGRVYVGYAAHCAGTGGATDTNGCAARSLPLGTRVRFAKGGSAVDGGTTVGHGRLAYSSWRTMRRLGTRDANTCDYNDFALVRVDKSDRGKVNPSVPFWGGPTGLDQDGTVEGETVHSFGSSSLRGGTTVLGPKQGVSLGTLGRGWSHLVYAVTPGIPGDSGSAFLDGKGRAIGTLSTITLAPLAGSNGVSDLRRELVFAQRHSGIPGLRLVRGTEEFAPVL